MKVLCDDMIYEPKNDLAASRWTLDIAMALPAWRDLSIPLLRICQAAEQMK